MGGHSDTPGGSRTVLRLIGVYDADSTLRGELTYWIGARLGRAHCALCDITHGSVRERGEWKRCREDLPVPFETWHRDDRPAEVAAAVGDVAPVVVADTEVGLVRLLGPAELEACDASPQALLRAIERAVDAADLAWPRPPGSSGDP